jgi:hypothetical protein
MRARKVYESIGFQRGKSPKESLDIGLASKAFPIISIYFGSEWHMGIDAGEILKDILVKNGSIKALISIMVNRDPDFKKVNSKIWSLAELEADGYSGIKWAHIFVPFQKKGS